MFAPYLPPTADAALLTPTWLTEAVEAIRQHRVTAKKHANGFYKVTLPRSGNLVRRLHVWTPGSAAEAEESNVHGHCWPYASMVLTGCLLEDLYVVTPGADYSEYAFEGNRSPLRYLRKVGLTHIGTDRHEAGSAYQRSASVLHRVRPWCADCLTVSAVIHPVSRAREASVFVKPGKSVEPDPIQVTTSEMALLQGALQHASARDRPGWGIR